MAIRQLAVIVIVPLALLLGGDTGQRVDLRMSVESKVGAERRLRQSMYFVCRDRETKMALLHDGLAHERVCRRDGSARVTSDSAIDSDTAWSRLRAPYGAPHSGR
jgi:hypothetical protein